MMRNCSPWALLPPAYSICTAAGLWVVYFMAVYSETITPLSSQYRKTNGSLYPPFISVAGNFPPASCIFSGVMNMAAFVGFIIAVLRYLQLRNIFDKSWLNFGSLVGFSVGCFGMTLIGNFQLFNQLIIHNSGTLMTFGLGCLFCWVQSYLTLRANLKNEGRSIAIARFLLSAVITLCIVLKYCLSVYSLMYAARCQWALVMFFLIFIGTFGIDFRHSSFEIVCRDTLRPPVGQSGTSEDSRQPLEQQQD
ncbi:transmembrane protein 150C [Stegastes partitus]|uniref:Transmembrane protein 150C n=1 Tax=Stegastes partitus TaxID=144197 RepID=A0A3B5BCR6_9TELE|nr:PREDICTED: transmembrane protein 150C [Stegastes partitus]XP_008299042.1 PREDICTED: transmembrane protein 150C [Stegastes partitus]